jgi:hypothetical protein
MIYVLDTDIFSLAFRNRPGLRERIVRERASGSGVSVGQILDSKHSVGGSMPYSRRRTPPMPCVPLKV